MGFLLLACEGETWPRHSVLSYTRAHPLYIKHRDGGGSLKVFSGVNQVLENSDEASSRHKQDSIGLQRFSALQK